MRLQGATLFDLIQFECMQRSRRIVRLRDGVRSGFLYFRDGNVVHALDNDLVGEPAFRSLLRWQRGVFESWDAPWPVEESISAPWQMLLLSYAHEQDEAARPRGPKLLSFPGRESAEIIEARDALRTPPVEPRTLVRISPDGLHASGGGAGDAEKLADVAAYAAQMADLVGEILVGGGFDVIDVALASGACVVIREPNGVLVAAKAGGSADPAELRRALGLPPEGK